MITSFQTDEQVIPLVQSKQTEYCPFRRRVKYVLAILFVTIMTALMVHWAQPSKASGSKSNVSLANNDIIGPSGDINIVEEAISSMQIGLNNEMNMLFNPSGASLKTDLTAVEWQYYFTPDEAPREDIIKSIKDAINGNYQCSQTAYDTLNIAEARNTFVGNDIKALRERKTIYSTDEQTGEYDRAVKVLIVDINNWESRDDSGIPLTKPKHKESNVDKEKSKYEINRVIKSFDDIQNIFQYSSTVKFTEEQEFTDPVENQNDINEYYNNVYSYSPSPFITKKTILSWTAFECDFGANVGSMEVEVQLCYVTAQDAINGYGTFDRTCSFKITYKIDSESNGKWEDYEDIQYELQQVLPYVV